MNTTHIQKIWDIAEKRYQEGYPAHHLFDRRVASYAQAMGAPLGYAIPGGLESDVLQVEMEQTPVSRGRHMFLRFNEGIRSYQCYGDLLNRITQQLRWFSQTRWALEAPLKSVQISLPFMSENAYEHTREVIDLALKSYLCVEDTLISLELDIAILGERIMNDMKDWHVDRMILNVGSFHEHWHNELNTGLDTRDAIRAFEYATGFGIPIIQAHINYGQPDTHHTCALNDIRIADFYGCNALSWWCTPRDATQCYKTKCCMSSLYQSHEYIQQWIDQHQWKRHRVWQAFDEYALNLIDHALPGVEDDLLSFGALTAGRVNDVAYVNLSMKEADEFQHALKTPAGPMLAFRIQPQVEDALKLTRLSTEGRCYEDAAQTPTHINNLEHLINLGFVEHDAQAYYHLTDSGRYWAHNITELIALTTRQTM